MHWCAHVTALLRGKNKRGSQREKRKGGKGKKKCKRGNSKEGIAMEHTVLLIEVV
jgi:hypothetical protein